tara:strand:+ start:485 stop:667 length:183 start_codon:yes stop_codon:yes gene_type:complete
MAERIQQWDWTALPLPGLLKPPTVPKLTAFGTLEMLVMKDAKLGEWPARQGAQHEIEGLR